MLLQVEKKIYDYDPYVLFNDWSSAVFEKLHHNVYGATEDEYINIYGEELMVVDGIVQECSVFDFFTELLLRLGIYSNEGNGYKMNEDNANKLICSAKSMEVVTEMFNDFHIKVADPNDGVLVKDFLTKNDKRVANDLECAEYLRFAYGGENTIDGLIEYLSEYINRKK